jgi:hypothetical protein
MAVVRFPRPYREPPPEEPPQLELWPDLPALLPPDAPLTKRELSSLLAAMARDLAAITAFVDSVQAGLELLQREHGEDTS